MVANSGVPRLCLEDRLQGALVALRRRIVWCLGFSCSLAACSNIDGPGAPPQVTFTPSEQQVATSGNDFSFAIFQQLARSEKGKNVFISPLSASMSLGM